MEVAVSGKTHKAKLSDVESVSMGNDIYRHSAKINGGGLDGRVWFLTKNVTYPGLRYEGAFGKAILIMHFNGTIL